MEKKFKVADFATLIGIAPKTVYKMIERNEILTDTERVNNRNTTVIITSDEQIAELQKIYSKSPVNDGNYYENVTVNNHSMNENESYNTERADNNSILTSDVIDRIITLNEGYNEQLKTVTEKLFTANDELVKVKSQQLLLEDKAGREGYYLNEINTLSKDNKQLVNVNNRLKYVIGVLLLIIFCTFTYLVTSNMNNSKSESDLISTSVETDKKIPAKIQNGPQQEIKNNVGRKK